MGLSIAQADLYLKRLERFFTFLPDTEEVYRNWRELIVNHSVSGVKVHDAKIVAAMKAHNIQNPKSNPTVEMMWGETATKPARIYHPT